VVASQSKSERSRLIKEADRLVSLYTRLKDSVNGRAVCVTCGLVDNWKRLHNGHYLSRRFLATRWDDMNNNVQCIHCNITLGGNLEKYKEYIIKKHGVSGHIGLQQKIRLSNKITNYDIKLVIEKYKNMLGSLV
jgi:hypothetical protein